MFERTQSALSGLGASHFLGGNVLLCLYRHPVVTPDTARLAVVRDDDIVDVHLACFTSMVENMKPRRAMEIATALCPSDLLGFLEGGRHAWNALDDSFERLADRLQVGLEGPDGEQVVLAKDDVRLVPIVPPAAGWSTEALGEWTTTPVPSPGSSTIIALHTDGQAYLPEYFAVMATTVADVSSHDAISAVALAAVVRPSRPESACLLYKLPYAPADELDLVPTMSAAVSAASRTRTLYTGDVVRCGPAIVHRNLDLRDAKKQPSLIEDIVPSR